jgi:hypothetical protein
MDKFTQELKQISNQVDELVIIYNNKRNTAENLSKEHLEQIKQIQNKLTPLGSNKPEQNTGFFNNIFKSSSKGGRYSHKRRSVKRRSTKKGGRKHK